MYLATKFRFPRHNCTLITFIKPIAKENVRLSIILLFAFHKNIT